MGPTNVALVKYFEADQRHREAQAKLDAASKDVRVQDRRVHDAAEKHKLAQQLLKQNQSKAAQLELDLKSRDAHIEKLRVQQQEARNNKEYQTFLVEINTAKVDRNKVEDDTMKLLELVERGNKELAELATLLEGERTKLAAMRKQVGDKLAAIQAEIDAIKPQVEEAGKSVPPKSREMFDRMSERFDGEAMSAISKPDRRREEYVCTACNMDLVVDVYNKLHTRDELVFCPSCRRILFIPDDLPPEVAIKGKHSALAEHAGATLAKRPSTKTRSARITRSKFSAASSNDDTDPIQRVLLKAAGESAQNAIAAGSDPAEFEVQLDGKTVGTFKGQSAENLQRTARFCLNEAGITGEVTVIEKTDSNTSSSESASGEGAASANASAGVGPGH